MGATDSWVSDHERMAGYAATIGAARRPEHCSEEDEDQPMDDLIDVFVDAAQDAAGWEPALAALREHCAAEQVVLYTFVAGQPARGRGYDVAAVSRQLWSFDPAPGADTDACRDAVSAVAGVLPRTRATARHGLVSRRVRVAGAGPGLVLHCAGDAVHGVLGVFPGAGRQIPPAVARALRDFMPHLWRALKVRRHHGTVAARARSLEKACERLSVGVLQTDAEARPLWANAAARQVLADGDALAVKDGRLATARAEDGRVLRALLRSGSAPVGEDRRRVRLGLVQRGNRRVPMITYVIASGTEADAGRGEDSATLFVVDPTQAARVSPALLQRIFAFTPAESEVAARLLGGRPIEKLAADLGVTRQTVRQHLKRVFDKTATHRQAELLMVLSSAVGWFRVAQED